MCFFFNVNSECRINMLDLFYQTFSHFFFISILLCGSILLAFLSVQWKWFTTISKLMHVSMPQMVCFSLSLFSMIYFLRHAHHKKLAQICQFPFFFSRLIVVWLSRGCQSFSASIRNKFGQSRNFRVCIVTINEFKYNQMVYFIVTLFLGWFICITVCVMLCAE